MKQRDIAAVVGGLVAGFVLAAIVGAGVFGWTLGGDRETDVTLSAGANAKGACELAKATGVRVRQDQHLTWKVENYCLSEQTVMVGDFRDESAAAATDCSQPGAGYPFGDGDRSVTLDPAELRSDGSIKPAKGSIKLKANKLPQGQNARLYAFNICLGGTPADPWIIVER